MKKSLNILSCCLLLLTIISGCKKEGNYPGGTISPYIAIFDVRDLYTGSDVTLTKQSLFGSDKITGVVVSDHSGGNLPAGLLILQDRRRLSQLRGIAVNIGADAAKYVPGDSVVVTVEGGVLKRENGMLQITGIPATGVTKVASGVDIPVNRVPANQILANPDKFEGTLVAIVKGGFNPLPAANAVLSGDKLLNDGFGDLNLHTESSAKFANDPAPFLANFYTIVFNKAGADKQLVPELRLRTGDDVVVLSSTINVTPIVISGFISDVAGGDGNYEYIQLMATRDIDFAVTPFSVVTTNNAGTATPTGVPVNGWATGGMRTFKFNLTSGKATKGSFFYVGGSNKRINGGAQTNPVRPTSTDISSANWIRSFNYTTTDGDGFGTKTGGLLANSGNASGIAVFEGINVTASSTPIDVIFVATGGSLFQAGSPARGYRIGNTDWYDIKNPITLQDQPFYRQGSNTLSMVYTTSDLGYFYVLGGEYNATLGRWMKARSQTNLLLEKTSTLSQIEGEGSTKLLQ